MIDAVHQLKMRGAILLAARSHRCQFRAVQLLHPQDGIGQGAGVTCRRGWGKNYPPRPVEEALEIVRRSKATGVALQFDPAIVTAEYIAAFHRAGYYVNVWTVDDAKSALLAVERGADTVTSNRPGKLLESSPASEPRSHCR